MADLLMRMPVPYEPKKKNRFIFRFPTPLGIQEWFVASGSRPSISIDICRAPAGALQISVTGRMGYAAGYKKDVELELLDPTGVVIEKWILQGTMLTNVNFNDLDYGSSDIADISASLRFDRAISVF